LVARSALVLTELEGSQHHPDREPWHALAGGPDEEALWLTTAIIHGMLRPRRIFGGSGSGEARLLFWPV